MINTNLENIQNELQDIINLFFEDKEVDLLHVCKKESNIVKNLCTVTVDGENCSFEREDKIKQDLTVIEEKRMLKRYAKLCLYQTLSKLTKKDLPWGSLTGIRPTKIGYDLLENGVDIVLLKQTLEKDFFISPQKAKLVVDIIKNQNSIIKNDHLIDFYVNIPICPSRCSYCSFISTEFKRIENKLDSYLDALEKEIEATKKLISDKAYVVRTIYIGGGTPSVLSPEQLDRLLSLINYPVNEFTVECGRADTITREKLEVLKAHGVTRICINPQTFCKKTLKLIGRSHTVEQVLQAYSLALEYGFVVNMDFIAGLPEESLTTFKKTIKTALEFAPHNITVHTLSLKKGSELIATKSGVNQNKVVEDMVSFAYEKLTEAGYKPYYLYRQKHQMDAQENVGYAQKGYNCIFNIDSMEETNTIIACGANAITKRVYGEGGRIERCANVKMIEDYISRIDDMIERKKKLFE